MRPPSLFVGSSSEARPVAEVITSLLGVSLTCMPWWKAFELGTFTQEALEAARTSHRFGVFIARADDILLRRDRREDVVRDNVIAEFFLFVGVNGRDHTYLVVDRSVMPTLPSDLAGFVFTT
jgi:predicted nucleotide-binding protein